MKYRTLVASRCKSGAEDNGKDSAFGRQERSVWVHKRNTFQWNTRSSLTDANLTQTLLKWAQLRHLLGVQDQADRANWVCIFSPVLSYQVISLFNVSIGLCQKIVCTWLPEKVCNLPDSPCLQIDQKLRSKKQPWHFICIQFFFHS